MSFWDRRTRFAPNLWEEHSSDLSSKLLPTFLWYPGFRGSNSSASLLVGLYPGYSGFCCNPDLTTEPFTFSYSERAPMLTFERLTQMRHSTSTQNLTGFSGTQRADLCGLQRISGAASLIEPILITHRRKNPTWSNVTLHRSHLPSLQPILTLVESLVKDAWLCRKEQIWVTRSLREGRFLALGKQKLDTYHQCTKQKRNKVCQSMADDRNCYTIV